MKESNSKKIIKNKTQECNQKYFYNKDEDTLIINSILQDLEQRKKDRKHIFRNLMHYKGIHL